MTTFREVSPTQVRDWLQTDPDAIYLLDVRELSEHQRCRLPHSTLIPLGQLQSRLAELPQDARIVCYCHHGGRSARACSILAQSGLKHLYNMDGGIDRWALDIDPAMPRY